MLTSGTTIGYGEMRVQVSNASGERLFDEAAVAKGSALKQLIADAAFQRAIQAMRTASPGGHVEVTGGDSRFEGKASLAGFRELWQWGVENCQLPPINGSN